MKKIGLLLLALVIALGALGVGYAKWTDTVAINGTVNTGTLIMGIHDLGTDDGVDLSRELAKDPLCSPQDGVPAGTEYKDVAYAMSTDSGAAVCTGYVDAITEVINNAYPGYAPTFSIAIANCGTVPLKIEELNLGGITGTNLLPWMKFVWQIIDEDGISHGYYSGNVDALYLALLGQQIRGNDSIQLNVKVCFQEYGTVDNAQVIMPQGATMGFNVVITGSQWNEVAAAPIYPTTTVIVTP
jgi:predicted ribosomally synthesized peptide with SipW-like signal peptide